MGGPIPAEALEAVRLATDIVQLVGEYVRLERRGKNYVGLCPFHAEREPSFTVSPDKQIFYCFGCGVGGNVFKFLMLLENLTFPEAVHKLAERAGIALPRFAGAGEEPKSRPEEEAWEVNALARDFFRQCLKRPEGREAREYLERRGISSYTQELFQLGYAPPGWDNLAQFLSSRGCPVKLAVDLGLLAVGERGRPYDRFRHRLIFPICNAQGRVVGFGARVLDESQPKYLNTPETPVFSKGKVLFGLHLAKGAIREKGYAIIMEGYMDVITAHQHGISNAVASLGTSLTQDQARLLSRYTRRVVIAYDSDAAGVAATVRGLDLLQQEGFSVRVAVIPQGKDPDEFIRHQGRERWNELVERSLTLLDYKLDWAVKKGEGLSAALAQVLPNLAAMEGELERQEAIKHVAARLSVSWEAVKDALRRYSAEAGKKWAKSDKNVKRVHTIVENTPLNAELLLVRLLLRYPEYLPLVQQELPGFSPHDPDLSRIYFFLCRQGNPAGWMNELGERGQDLLGYLLVEDLPLEDPARVVRDLIANLRQRARRLERERLIQELAEAERLGDEGRVQRVLSRLQELLPTGRGEN
ncbi:DNA primase [Desulfovirgula thermocuniculi]|uniref:DNA primase n=1 Tax=Desulfovirgula thermocuniculi TaxID=348842 RepID=UPI000554821B|nr:DNA primase [Desulfovirgula thermocuniculi]